MCRFSRFAVSFLLLLTFLLSSGSAAESEIDFSHPRYKTRNKRRWGVEVASVHLIANGYLLAFRYRVLDAEKAEPLFERRTKPRLLHEASGAEFIVPAPQKTGPLRNSNAPQENRIYWMAFANPGKFIQAGDRVTILIGEFRASHLVVE